MESKTYLFIGIILGLSIIGVFIFFYFNFNSNGISGIIASSGLSMKKLFNLEFQEEIIKEIDEKEIKSVQKKAISSSELFQGYEVYLSGREAELFENPEVYDNKDGTYTLQLDYKTQEERTKEECIIDEKTKLQTCNNIITEIPNKLDIKDEYGIKEDELILNPIDDKLHYTFDSSKEYIKIGDESILIIPSLSYY